MRVSLVVLVLGALWSRQAWAETGELSVGVEGALAVPSFRSSDPAAFALGTWSVGGLAQYGVLDDLYAQARFSFMAYSGETNHVLQPFGRPLEGTLRFGSRQYHAEIGARYKLLAGYLVAPYVETHVGFLWSTYHDQRLLTPDGRDYGIDVEDLGEPAFTLGGGLAVDVRLLNRVFVGVAARVTYAFGNSMQRYYVSVPVQVSVYW